MAQSLHLFSDPPVVETITPLMAQYLRVKADYAEYLLFFRLGDFYELFFDDAVRAAAALDIALTKRGKHQGADIPMCGVPWHQADIYLARLIRHGFKIAICEQVETEPAGKPGKTLIERKVVRVITPGTVTEDNLLDAKRNNFILSIGEVHNKWALAWMDVSTGAFMLQATDAINLPQMLGQIDAGEIIVSERLLLDQAIAAVLKPYVDRLSAQPDVRFAPSSAKQRLQKLYGIETLDGIGDFTLESLAAVGGLLSYVELTQQGSLPVLRRPEWQSPEQFLTIDAATARNLELKYKLTGERQGSLLSCIDRTVTGAGARLLDRMLSQPLTDINAISARLDAVEYALRHQDLRKNLRDRLTQAPDLERALSRLMLNRGQARDLASLRDALCSAAGCREAIADQKDLPPMWAEIAQSLGQHDKLLDTLKRALASDLPVFLRDGNFIATGYAADLDYLRQLRDESQRLIAALQQDYILKTGIANLKIRHNNILGYFIEIPPKLADKMGADFIHRQTLATAARYTTPQLNEMEQKLAKADSQALALEMQIFESLVNSIKDRAPMLQLCAQGLAMTDVIAGLAQLAQDQNYCRPVLDQGLGFKIVGGRHPVVEQFLHKQQQKFIANDCTLENADGRLWLITGPNMAGKSTYLRQNAVIAILAQMGSFVPASSCHIGIVDKIFSRVGAADDLARGQSTFMVEMVETAAILHQATSKSLVILDEIGRGTATFDGLSIAWATLEYLHNQAQCRGLFATHYHELTALAEQLNQLKCYTMRIKEWQNEIIFLHEIMPGRAERSYGIHVAKIAGIPKPVIDRATQILQQLESDKKSQARLDTISVPPQAVASIPDHWQKVENILQSTRIDELSPRAAWDLVENMQSLLKKDNK